MRSARCSFRPEFFRILHQNDEEKSKVENSKSKRSIYSSTFTAISFSAMCRRCDPPTRVGSVERKWNVNVDAGIFEISFSNFSGKNYQGMTMNLLTSSNNINN